MENQTSVKYFHILAFYEYPKSKPFVSGFLSMLYLFAVFVNFTIISVISLEPHLHHPMYLFICNLSVVDMLFTTVSVPKFLYILLSGNNIVSFEECFTQFYFHVVSLTVEDFLLFIIGYDRYVAICLPLYYQRIMSNRNCTMITMGLWVTGWLNSLLITLSVLNMSICHSNNIHQFFCDLKSMTFISCTGTISLYIVIVLELLLFCGCPFLFTVISYKIIFMNIMRIKTRDGRRKAFSTCSSHLSIITLYYSSGLLGLLLPSYSDVLDFVLFAFFTIITPIINPMIYSLQNSDVKTAILRFFPQSHYQ